jgi:5-methylcytosine-specific restriction endonuclease McrA
VQYCSSPSCRVLLPSGARCPEHTKAYRRSYDAHRGSRIDRGYDKAWYRWRTWAVQKYQLVLCGDRPEGAPGTTDSLCQQQGFVQVGDDLDHIEPISGRDDPRRLDPTNVQLLCDRAPNYCHKRKTRRETIAGGRGHVNRRPRL